MNKKTRAFDSTVTRASVSFLMAIFAAKITFIPFIVLVFFEKVLPYWVAVSVLIVGISLSLFVGFKCFRWFYRKL